MADRNKSKTHTSRANQKSPKPKHAQQNDLVKKLPDETQPAEEWGERLATGKAIATSGEQGAVGGGKEAAVGGRKEAQDQ
jgi:hypothetical protein